MTRPILRRSALCTAVLLAMSPAAFATDYTYTGGNYAPGITAPDPLMTGDVLDIVTGGYKYIDGVTLTNASGTVNWSGDDLYLQNGGAIVNESLWNMTSDNSIVYNGGNAPSFTNTGTLRKSGGTGASNVSVAFTNSGTIDAQTGSIVFNANNATFNNGSNFTGAGSVVVNSNATFAGSLTSANLMLTSGTFSGNNAAIHGSVNFNGGALDGSWAVAAGQTLVGTTGGYKYIDGVVTNNGTFSWQSTDALYLQNGASLVNNGLYDIQAGTTIANNGGNQPVLTNNSAATLRVASGQTANINNVNFTNNGGTITANGTLNFNGGDATFNTGTVFNGSGASVMASSANFNGAISSGNLQLVNGRYTGSAAVLSGTTLLTGGYLSGGWTLASGQTLNVATGGYKYLDSGSFTNKGAVNWSTSDAFYLQYGSSFDNQGSFSMLAGTTIVNNGGNQPTFTNNGTFTVAAGQAGAVQNVAFTNNHAIVSNGSLSFNGGDATFNAGSTFSGSGVITIDNSATFNGSFSTGNLSLVNGRFQGNGAVVNGTLGYSGGYVSGDWTVAAGQTLAASTGAYKYIDSGSVTNQGTIAWNTSDPWYLQAGGTLLNPGLFEMKTGTTIVNNGGNQPSFVNTGTLQVDAGQSGTVRNVAFVNNAGTINVGSGAQLTFNGGDATFNNGTIFNGAGTVAVTNNATFAGTYTAGNLQLQNGAYFGNAAVAQGSTTLSGGYLQGGWTVANGATLNLATGGYKYIDSGTLTNNGTLAYKTTDAFYLQSGAALVNNGKIDLQTDAAIVYNGGNGVSFTNNGLILKSAGTGTSVIGNGTNFNNLGTVNVASGIIQLPDSFTNNGTLMGGGSYMVNGNGLTNAGHIAPGNSIGTLGLTGNFAQLASGFLDTELASSTSFDLFSINGTASLAGTLALSCTGSCALHDGDVFTILDSTGTLSGSFSDVTIANFGVGFDYSVVYDYADDAVKLEVITAGVTNPVPEPETWALLLGGLGLMVSVVRRRRSGR